MMSPEAQAVEEANRAAILTAMQREGVRVHEAEGRTFARVGIML